MRLPPSVSSRNAAWPSQVSDANSGLLCSGSPEHRRTVRPGSEARSPWVVGCSRVFSPCWPRSRTLLQALLWALALVLLLLSCAVRSPATQLHELPPLAWSALMGCLGVFGLKAVLAAWPYLGSSTLRPAK